jgi:hypothetical protein
VPTAPPVYFTNPNHPYPFSPIINQHQQQHYQNSSSPTALPTVTHIPLLTGRSDWGPWFVAVGNHIGNLGLIPHVCDDPKPDDPFDPSRIPTYPPVITALSTQAELSFWDSWWRSDGIAAHILTSRLSVSARSQLPVSNPLAGPQRRTAREVFGHLRRLFGGGDYTSSSALKTQLRNLRCGARVVEYVTQWRAGVAQLNDSGYPFTLRESLEAFVDHLPEMDHKPTKDLVYQSLNRSDLELPSFESILERVITTDTHIYRNRPYAARSRPHPNTTSASQAPPNMLPAALSTNTPTTPSNPTVTTSTTSRTSRSAKYCTGCKRTGHLVFKCWHTENGQQAADHNRTAQAHVATAEVEDNPDGGGTTEAAEPTEDATSIPFAACTTHQHACTAAAPINNDIHIDWYDVGMSQSFAFSSLSDLLPFESPVSCATITNSFNTILDSGCTNHIIRDRALFWTYNEDQAVPVKTANCGILNTLARGDVKFHVSFGQQQIILTLRDCLHAPDAPLNLLSVGAMQEKHMRIHFNEEETIIHFPSDHPVLSRHTINAVVFRQLSFLQCDFLPIELPLSDGSELAFPTFAKVELTPALWHRRLGHIGIDATRAVLTKNYAEGVVWTGSFAREFCIPCLIGKHPQQPYTNYGNRATKICELLHMDTCGPFPVMTPHKKSLFWGLLDDKSNFGHVGLLSAKSDVFQDYKKVEASWEAKSGNRVIAIRMDGAKEFSLGNMGAYLKSRGITMQITTPYAHSQNGKAERFVRTIEDGAQTLLADSKLTMSFWGDAALTMNYLRNRAPTVALPSGVTAFEMMNHRKPNLSNLRVWGCQCFVTIPPELHSKGGPRRLEAIFVGYEEDRIGWRVRDLQGKYHFSRDVIFNESVPGHLAPIRKIDKPTSSSSDSPAVATRPARPLNPTSKGQAFLEAIHIRDKRLALRRLPKPVHRQQEANVIEDFVSLSITDDLLSTDFVDDLASHEQDAVVDYCLLTSLDPHRFARPRIFDLSKAPESYYEAIARPDADVWKAAMQRELTSLEDRHAFERTTLPSGRKAIGLRWCYMYKYNPDGSIILGKEKARLVAQGFSQRPEDYGSTYAPVAKMTSIRTILAYANHRDYELMSFDIKTAFLHTKLTLDIYCKQIPGFPEADPHTVLRLLVALYGLRQSSYEFYMLLLKIMTRLGLIRCEVDHAVFSGRWTSPPHPSIPMPSNDEPLTLLIPVHVDDGLVATNSIPLYHWFIAELCKEIEAVDLGPASLYLGIRIIRDRSRRKLWLSQKAFITNLLASWNLTPSNSHTSAVPLRHKLHTLPEAPLNSLPNILDADIKINFQRLVGSLIYLAVCTRPDIAYVAMALGQHNANPTRAHLLAAKGILRYLAGSLEFSLEYGLDTSVISPSVQETAKGCILMDADWATDEKDRKSISGYCFYYLNSLVSWSAVKQKTMALSSTESEYFAMTHAMKEGLWLRLFLKLHDLPVPHPFPLLCDNQSTLALVQSESVSSRSKHIDIRYHFIREHVSDGTFATTWIPTEDMTADILTKPLPYPAFSKHRLSLGLVPT